MYKAESNVFHRLTICLQRFQKHSTVYTENLNDHAKIQHNNKINIAI